MREAHLARLPTVASDVVQRPEGYSIFEKRDGDALGLDLRGDRVEAQR